MASESRVQPDAHIGRPPWLTILCYEQRAIDGVDFHIGRIVEFGAGRQNTVEVDAVGHTSDLSVGAGGRIDLEDLQAK